MNTIQWIGLIAGVAVGIDLILVFFGGRWLWKKVTGKSNSTERWGNWISGNEVHTMPIGDKITHYTEDSCGCSPKTVPVPREDGSVGWQIIHNALDGRD
jgi:hypothetical protein